MPWESANITHLSVAMTTTKEQTTQAVSGQRWSVDRYVQLAVIVIGVVGTAGNALILYALVASKQHKKHVLMFNQNALDLFSSVFLIVSYAVKFANVGYVGALGYWLCVLFVSEIFVWWGFIGSVVNLATITVERYLKVVHNAWSKRWLRPKVINLAMAFAWLVGIVSNTPFMFETSGVKDGKCYTWMLYKSNVDRILSLVWYILSFYVIILAIFIFCYGRILITIRRQAKVMACHSSNRSTTAQNHQSKVIKTNVIKTMVIVSAFYAIAWLPTYVYHVFVMFDTNLTYLNSYFYATMFMANLYTCTNPFIYATKFDPVRQILKNMTQCQKISVHSTAGQTGTASIRLKTVVPAPGRQ